MKNKEEKSDEEYLNQEFPKGKTKFRGQAMVLLALARKEGKAELINQWKSDIADAFDNGKVEGKSESEIKFKEFIRLLKEELYLEDEGFVYRKDIKRTIDKLVRELKDGK